MARYHLLESPIVVLILFEEDGWYLVKLTSYGHFSFQGTNLHYLCLSRLPRFLLRRLLV